MEYIIREIKKSEYPLLDNFLYEAIFVPEGMDAPAKSVMNTPELLVYISDFGTYQSNKSYNFILWMVKKESEYY